MLGCGLPERDRPAAARRCSTSGCPPRGPTRATLERRACARRGVDARVEARPEDDEWRTRDAGVPPAGRGRPGACWCARPGSRPRPPLLDVEIDPGHGLRHRPARHHPRPAWPCWRACRWRRAACSTPAAAPGCCRSRPAASGFDRGHGRSTPTRSRWTPPWPTPAATAWALTRRPPDDRPRPAARRAEVVLANLTGDGAARCWPRRCPRPRPRHLIASGMRPEEVDGVAEAFAARRPARRCAEVRGRGLGDAPDGAGVRHTFRYVVRRGPARGGRGRAVGRRRPPPGARGAPRARATRSS